METRLRVVTTLRSEFLSRAPERAGLTEEAHSVVEPLSRARLPEVIVKPAQRAGIEFEPGLVERMVEEASWDTTVRLWDAATGRLRGNSSATPTRSMA